MSETGNFVKSTLLAGYSDLPPLEQYHKSAFLENMVNVHLQKQHPALFEEVNARYQRQAQLLEEEIKNLKK